MTVSHPIIFVLWGQGFDEIAASIFVAELRHLGKRVKLVGLNSQHISGQHGVTLVPDLSLGQALRSANRIQCLIIPAPLAALQQFSYDPRLAELLALANNHHALIVTKLIVTKTYGSMATDEQPVLTLFANHAIEYQEYDEVIGFVRHQLILQLGGSP